MTYKTINISEEVYKKLGITKESKGISEFFGIWKDLPKEILEIMESAHKEMREEINKKFS